MYGLEQRDSTEPAKLADRVIAPGDGAAEPGERNPKRVRATKCATDGWKIDELRVIIITLQIFVTNHLSPASQALLDLRL